MDILFSWALRMYVGQETEHHFWNQLMLHLSAYPSHGPVCVWVHKLRHIRYILPIPKINCIHGSQRKPSQGNRPVSTSKIPCMRKSFQSLLSLPRKSTPKCTIKSGTLPKWHKKILTKRNHKPHSALWARHLCHFCNEVTEANRILLERHKILQTAYIKKFLGWRAGS